GKPLHRLADQDDRHLQQGFPSPDSKHVVSVEQNPKDCCLRLWEVATGRLVREFGDHPCAGGCFSPDGRTFATLATSQAGDPSCRPFAHVIALWDLATGHRLGSWTGHTDGVYCGVFTADGKTLVTGGGDSAVRFWDPATSREIRRPLEGTAPVGHLTL